MRGSVVGTAKIKGKYLEYAGRKAEIVFVNERLLNSDCLDDVAGYPVVGNCLAPQVRHGDLTIVAHNVKAQDGDIVLVIAGEQRFASRYRNDGEDTWLESAHGKKSLEGCSIVGVALMIGRFPLPTMKVGGIELVYIPIEGTVIA